MSPNSNSDKELTVGEHVLSAAGAAFLSAIIFNPLDVAKAFRVAQGDKAPGVWKTLHGVINPVKGTSTLQNLYRYRLWWTGLGAQLSRDVPFSAVCWPILQLTRKKLLSSDKEGLATILGANFSAGFVAGIFASAVTCPLDVAKTRRQIEMDPVRALRMTTKTTLLEIWRDGGLRGLFAGFGPRICRAGPSVGIVVSFYEGVKYTLRESK